VHRSFPRDSITCELQENEKSGGFILTDFFVFCNSYEYIKDREGAKRIRGSDVFASNTISQEKAEVVSEHSAETPR